MIGFLTNDMEQVGYYEQAQKIVKATLLVLSALQIVMNSRIANAYAKNDKKEIGECLNKSLRFLWLLTIPMMFGLIAIAPKFVPWFYGNEFEPVVNIMIALAPILIIIGFNGITGNQYLIQIGNHKIYTCSVVMGAIINLILNIILIYYFDSVGACIASLIAEFSILVIQLFNCREQFNLKEIFKLSIKNWISGIVMFIVLILLVNKLEISIINTILEIFIGGIIYVICLFLLKDKFLRDLCNQIFFTMKNMLHIN